MGEMGNEQETRDLYLSIYIYICTYIYIYTHIFIIACI